MKEMKKVLFLMFLLFLGLGTANVRAQVRIGGNTAPDAAAVLDLNADGSTTGTKGLALPRVNLTSNTMQLVSGVTNLTGMLVYNTTATLGAGIYFWAGSQWVIISGDGIVGNELTDTIAGGGLNKTGAGTAASPYKVGIKTGGVTSGMIADSTIMGRDIALASIGRANTTGTWGTVIITLSGSAVGSYGNGTLPAPCTYTNTSFNWNSPNEIVCGWESPNIIGCYVWRTATQLTPAVWYSCFP